MPDDRREPSIDALEGILEERLAASAGREEAIRSVVEALGEWGERYDWTGVYMLEGSELVLAHEVGRPTPHRRIPIDRGICGAAAREERTIVVDDVQSDPRYLACTLETRSEIVVPLRAGGRVVGEIDVDSDTPAAFTDHDRRALERASALLSRHLEGPPRREARPATPRPRPDGGRPRAEGA